MKEGPYHNPAYFSIYHDTRKANKEGRNPVKLRVYHNNGSKNPQTRLYSLKISLTREEFEDVWGQPNPRGKNREMKDHLENILFRAKKVGSHLNPFSIKAFKEHFFMTKRAEGHDIFSLFDRIINDHRQLERHGTADAYLYAANSFERFFKEKKGLRNTDLAFEEVDQMTLEEYEKWMTEEKSKSMATVGTYTRHLKAVFNQALEEGITDKMPFGRKRYRCPNPRKKPKNLSVKEFQQLFTAETKTSEEELAKDLFFLSFFLYGINIQDLISLTYENLSTDEKKLTYYRQKTKRTAKEDLERTVVPFNELNNTESLINKYLNPKKSSRTRLFDFGFEVFEDKEKLRRQAKNKNSTINRNLKKIAKRNGLPEGISWNWARHTFVTLFVNVSGGSLEQATDLIANNGTDSSDNYRGAIEEEQKVKMVKTLDEMVEPAT